MADKVDPRTGELVTTNYGWTKPTVGASTDAWGGYINSDLDGIDNVVHGIQTSLANYLPLAGGTMTGALNGTSAVFSSVVGASQVNANQGLMVVYKGATTNPQVIMNDGSTNRSAFYFNVSTGQTTMADLYSSTSIWLDPAGNFEYSGGTGTAMKIGGGSWAASSDARIKNVQGDYALGLTEVMALRPVVYTYKGNDASSADAPSMHAAVAANQTSFVGLIAQEVEPIFPGMVTQREGYIDRVKVEDLRDLNTTELIFALVNAVKTLAARVAELEAARG
jgi:hypothetical protein